jgi:hypothetical protein
LPGYLFAANLGSPDFFTIFDETMETSVTNAKLEKMLIAYKRRKPESTYPKPIPMKIKVASIEAAKAYFEKKTGMYTKNDLQTLAEELIPILNQGCNDLPRCSLQGNQGGKEEAT